MRKAAIGRDPILHETPHHYAPRNCSEAFPYAEEFRSNLYESRLNLVPRNGIWLVVAQVPRFRDLQYPTEISSIIADASQIVTLLLRR